MMKDREFDVPDYRTGDVVKFTMLSSQSEKKEIEVSGVVYRKKAPNSIRANCRVNFNSEGVNASYGVNLYSPMLKSFEIWKYGSNQLRKKLNHIPGMDMSAGRLQEPIAKGQHYKLRSNWKEEKKVEIKKKSADKGKIKRGQFKLDEHIQV